MTNPGGSLIWSRGSDVCAQPAWGIASMASTSGATAPRQQAFHMIFSGFWEKGFLVPTL
jgi:hypothetical protein